jgi:hypothetical protein
MYDLSCGESMCTGLDERSIPYTYANDPKAFRVDMNERCPAWEGWEF